MATRGRRATTVHPLAHALAFALTACNTPEGPHPCAHTAGLCAAAPTGLRWSMTPAVGTHADLDGDGRLDAVLAAPSGGMLLDRSGAADDRLVLYEGGASDVRLLDIDRDGDDDVLLGALDPPRLTLFHNLGTQRLSAGLVQPIVGAPQALWTGPLTPGGPLRIAAVTAAPPGLALFDDALNLVRRHDLGDTPVAIAGADVDGDSALDLAIADFGASSFHLLRGDGAGDFAAAITLVSVGLPESIDIADLDGDDHLDVLLGGRADHRAWLHLGDGEGTFEPGRPIEVTRTADASLGVAAIDGANGSPGWILAGAGAHIIGAQLDATLEVQRRVVSAEIEDTPAGDSTLIRLRRDGERLFAQSSTAHAALATDRARGLLEVWRTPAPPARRHSLAVGDLDLDGDLDIVVIADKRAFVYEAIAPDRWDPGPTTDLPGAVNALAIADVSGDGHPDLILGEEAALRVALGDGAGAFALAGAAALPFSPRRFAAIPRADAGRDDLLVAAHLGDPGDGALLLRFDAAGSLVEALHLFPDAGVARIHGVDVDGDGDQDLVATLRYADDVTLTIVRNLGGGSWEDPASLSLAGAVADLDLDSFGLVVADLDLDGTLDALVFGRSASALLRDLTALDPTAVEVLPHPYIFPEEGVIADVDADGRPDVLFDTFRGAAALLHPGFGAIELLDTNHRRSISTVFTDDGSPRALLVDAEGLTVSRFDEVPALALEARAPARGEVTELLAGDIDGDGDIDLVASSLREHHVIWGPVEGDPQEVVDVHHWTGDHSVLADFDADGADDLVVATDAGALYLLGADDRRLALRDELALDASVEALLTLPRPDAPPELGVVLRQEAGLAIATLPIAADRLGVPVVSAIDVAHGSVAAATPGDFDGDGFGDIALLASSAPHLLLLWGGADRTFAVTTLDVAAVILLAAADFDGDGRDALLVDDGTRVASIDLRDREPAAATPLDRVGGPVDPGPALAVGDIDGDGLDDIARLNWREVQLASPPAWQEALSLPPVRAAPFTGLAIADIDHDGLADLIGAHSDGLTLWRSSARSP